MENDPPHHCSNCDGFPYVEMPGTPVTWTRSAEKFICTGCGKYLSKEEVAPHRCENLINAFFMKVCTDVPAEND